MVIKIKVSILGNMEISFGLHYQENLWRRVPVTEKIKESSLKGPSLLFSYVPPPKIFLSVTPKTDFRLLYIEK